MLDQYSLNLVCHKQASYDDIHYGIIESNFTHKYDLIYSDTDSLVYSSQHPYIYQSVKDNEQHFDLAGSKRVDLTHFTK